MSKKTFRHLTEKIVITHILTSAHCLNISHICPFPRISQRWALWYSIHTHYQSVLHSVEANVRSPCIKHPFLPTDLHSGGALRNVAVRWGQGQDERTGGWLLLTKAKWEATDPVWVEREIPPGLESQAQANVSILSQNGLGTLGLGKVRSGTWGPKRNKKAWETHRGGAEDLMITWGDAFMAQGNSSEESYSQTKPISISADAKSA